MIKFSTLHQLLTVIHKILLATIVNEVLGGEDISAPFTLSCYATYLSLNKFIADFRAMQAICRFIVYFYGEPNGFFFPSLASLGCKTNAYRECRIICDFFPR